MESHESGIHGEISTDWAVRGLEKGVTIIISTRYGLTGLATKRMTVLNTSTEKMLHQQYQEKKEQRKRAPWGESDMKLLCIIRMTRRTYERILL